MFLIAGGSSSYPYIEDADLPRVPGDVKIMAEAFEKLGFTRVLRDVSLNASSRNFIDALSQWAQKEPSERDRLVFYYAGHGERTDARHYLIFTDSRPNEHAATAVPCETIVEILLKSRIQHALFILDTCYATAGLDEAAALVAQMDPRWNRTLPEGYYFIAAARRTDQAQDGPFAATFVQAIGEEQNGGSAQAWLRPDDLVRYVGIKFQESNPTQRPTHYGGGSGPPELIPNPRYRGAEPGQTVEEQDDARWLREQRKAAWTGHWLPRARGAELSSAGWYFTGRHKVLADLVTWLKAPDSDGRVHVVTGGPGTGKSAILAWLFALSRSDARHEAEKFGVLDGVPPETLPPLDAIDIALHARARAPHEIARELALSLAAREIAEHFDLAVDPDPFRKSAALLVAHIANLPKRLTILVDALDESTNPKLFAREILVTLAGLPNVWVLVASRPERPVGAQRARISFLGDARIIDLDDPANIGHNDVENYVRRLLLAEREPQRRTPYRAQPILATEVARAVSARAGLVFLIARLVARALMDKKAPVEFTDPNWQEQFPDSVGEAFEAWLDGLDEPQRKTLGKERSLELLCPLAYARGQGLPWANMWAPLTEATSDKPCSNAEIRTLLQSLAPFLVQDSENGRSVYRLYHHALAEHLRSGGEELLVEARISKALHMMVPRRSNGETNWEEADPYSLAYLPAHAAKGGTLDALLDDPGFLAAVSPQSLLRFRTATSSSKGQQAMDVYSTVSHSLLAARGALGRGSYLQMAARQMGYEELANRFTAEGLIGGWEVRATNHAVYTPHIVVDDLAGPGDLVKLLEPLEWEGGMALLWLCSNGQTIIEDIETATPFASFRVPTRGPIRGACLAQRGGKRLLVGCAGDSHVFVWDLDQQQMEREHTVLHPPLPGSSSLQLDYSQFEEVEMLALASQYLDESHGIQVRDLASGELLLEKDIGYWLAVDELRFLELSTGPALAAVGDEGDIKIWDLSTRELRRVILGDLASGTKVNCLKILQKRPKTLGVVSGGKGLLSTVDFENNSIKQITRQGAERASNNAAASGVSTPTTDFPDETKLLVDVAIRNRSHVGALFYETTGVVRFIDLQNGSEAFAPLNTPFDKYADEFTFYSNKGRMFFAGANNGVILGLH
jgi:hypothetical protein